MSGIHASIRNKTKFESLDSKQFSKDYGIGTVSGRRTLVCLCEVFDRMVYNNTLFWAGSGFPLGTSKTFDGLPYSWMDDGLNIGYSVTNYTKLVPLKIFPFKAKSWPEENATVEDWPPARVKDSQSLCDVKTCLSEKIEESCQLFVNIPICVIVIICNIIKLVCMFLATQEDRYEVLITIGDAITSFLQRPDPTTANDCMVDMSTMRLWGPQDYVWKSHHKNSHWKLLRRLPPPLRPENPPRRPRMRVNAVNICICALSYTFTLIAITLFLALVFHDDETISSGFDVGMGEINSATLLTQLSDSFVVNILIVNCIQLLVTGLYFLYNDALTRMLLAAEYNSYALERKPLRVSFPKGKQRSTFYLTIPYRYSVPVLITFTLVHWLVSEGFYFVQVMPHSIWNEEVPSRLLNTCGYCPKALIGALGLMFLMAVLIFSSSIRKFRSIRMPLAMNCSATISAACHRPFDDADAALKPVKWGEVDMKGLDAFGEISSSTSYRHCSFTSKQVVFPSFNVLYV